MPSGVQCLSTFWDFVLTTTKTSFGDAKSVLRWARQHACPTESNGWQRNRLHHVVFRPQISLEQPSFIPPPANLLVVQGHPRPQSQQQLTRVGYQLQRTGDTPSVDQGWNDESRTTLKCYRSERHNSPRCPTLFVLLPMSPTTSAACTPNHD